MHQNMHLIWVLMKKMLPEDAELLGENRCDESDAKCIQALHGTFYASCRAVYAHHCKVASKVDEAVMNLQISVQSSVRKAPNVLTHLTVVMNLTTRHALLSYAEFVKKWNLGTVKSHAILGKKALVLKLLMELAPRYVLQCIIGHCSIQVSLNLCIRDAGM